MEAEEKTALSETSSLPKGWAWLPVGYLAASERNAITDGPFGSKLKTEHYTRFGPRVVRLQNIGDGIFKDAAAHISEAHFASLQKHRIEAGDLAIALLGAVLPRACVIPDWLGPAIVKADCIRFRPNTALIQPKYLSHALNSPRAREQTSAIIHGVGRPRLSATTLKNMLVPVAPLSEQNRIVDALDELFSDLDAGMAALERVLEKLKLYRASVLKAAVDGTLTAEWRAQHPDIEPATQLLESILAERRRRWEEDQLAKFKEGEEPPRNWRARYKEPVAPDTDGLQDVPIGWTVASMDMLMTRITSGSRDWQQFYGAGSGTFIMAENVRPGLFDRRVRQAVNPPATDPSCQRSLVQMDDLLVTIVGANTGDVCRVPEPLPEHYVCQSVALMRPVESQVSKYLDCYCNSSSGAQLHYSRYIYGAGRPHLSFDQLRMTPVLLPSLAEQAVIVDAIEDQLSVTSHIEADIAAKLKAAQSLRHAILRHAFTGRLVPQDPNDEPASELLKRIAAERDERARSILQSRPKKKAKSAQQAAPSP